MSERRLLTLVLVLLLALAGLLFLWRPGGPPPATSPSPPLAAPPQGGDFTLQGRAGPLHLHNLRGKVVLLYFGYTQCPDICPTTLIDLRQALDRLTPEQRRQVQVVFVSLDPARDTPDTLADYVAWFDPTFLGVTGTPDAVAEVARRYGVVWRRVPAASGAGYLIDHSAVVYVIDRQGRLVGSLPHGTPPARIVATLRRQLAAGATPQKKQGISAPPANPE